MKSEKKLQKAVELLKAIDSPMADKAANLIIEFMTDNVKPSKGMLLCRDFISKDPVSPILHLILHDAEHKTAVATDAHALFSNEAEYIETDGHGLRDIFGNKAEENIGVFPKWFSIIPKQTEDAEIYEDLEETYKMALSEAKLQGKKLDKTEIFILVNEHQWMNAKHVGFMLRAGLDDWKVPYSEDEDEDEDEQKHKHKHKQPLYKEWDGKRLLLMPAYIGDLTPWEIKRKYKYKY